MGLFSGAVRLTSGVILCAGQHQTGKAWVEPASVTLVSWYDHETSIFLLDETDSQGEKAALIDIKLVCTTQSPAICRGG